MANNELTLSFGLPGLNEIIKVAKAHHMAYATMKKKYTHAAEMELIAQGCIPDKPFKMIDIEFTWIESGRARDPDNVRVGAKFVLDAMVNKEVIPNDTMEYVKLLTDKYAKAKERNVIVKWIGYTEEAI